MSGSTLEPAAHLKWELECNSHFLMEMVIMRDERELSSSALGSWFVRLSEQRCQHRVRWMTDE
jgi:hypothetical protein